MSTSNDSFSEQGSWDEISFATSETIQVNSGSTNVLLHTAATSGNVDVGGLLSHTRSGRKIRFMVRSDVNASATIRFLESGGVFYMSGATVSVALTVDEYAEFMYRQDGTGNDGKWMLTSTNGTLA